MVMKPQTPFKNSSINWRLQQSSFKYQDGDHHSFNASPRMTKTQRTAKSLSMVSSIFQLLCLSWERMLDMRLIGMKWLRNNNWNRILDPSSVDFPRESTSSLLATPLDSMHLLILTMTKQIHTSNKWLQLSHQHKHDLDQQNVVWN